MLRQICVVLAVTISAPIAALPTLAQAQTQIQTQTQADAKPDAVLAAISEDVLRAVRANKDGYKDNPEVLESQLLDILNPAIDFESFSKGVMGSYYKAATPAQRTAFITEFKATLVELYTSALVGADIKDIAVTDASSKKPGRSNVVMTATTAKNKSYTLQYNMRQDAGGQWMIRNIILEGVNIGLTYRNQFKSAMETENQDLARVIKLWPEIIEGG